MAEEKTISFNPPELELLKTAVQQMIDQHEPGSDQFAGIKAIKKQYEALAEKLNPSESNTGA